MTVIAYLSLLLWVLFAATLGWHTYCTPVTGPGRHHTTGHHQQWTPVVTVASSRAHRA